MLGIAIIIINLIAVISFPIFKAITTQQRIDYAPLAVLIFVSVYFTNLVTLCFYYRMSGFYIRFISKNYQKDKRKFRIIVTFCLINIIISNTRENFLLEIMFLVYGSLNRKNYTDDKIYNQVEEVFRPLNYFRAILPFTISVFVTLIIRYIANDTID